MVRLHREFSQASSGASAGSSENACAKSSPVGTGDIVRQECHHRRSSDDHASTPPRSRLRPEPIVLSSNLLLQLNTNSSDNLLHPRHESISAKSSVTSSTTADSSPLSSASSNSSYYSFSQSSPFNHKTISGPLKELLKLPQRVKRSVSYTEKRVINSKSVTFNLRHSQRMTSASFSSSPPSAHLSSMFDTINDSHSDVMAGLENTSEVSLSDAKYRNQTYKDRRKNYRLEKKKLADELISAIQDPTTIVMSDWLKVRTNFKQWNKYFCELRPGSLYLYKSQKTHKSSNWIGTVMLKMCEVIERPSKKNGFCFKLFHPLDHPIWSPKGPRGEAFTSIMFPLPISSSIFRAPSEEAGRKWMEAIELSLKYSSLVHKQHLSSRDSVPTTPLSNGSGSNPTSAAIANSNALQSLNTSIDRSDDELLSNQHNQSHSLSDSRILFNETEIEKHFDLDDDGHTDHGEHDDSQEHHSTENSDDSLFEEDFDGVDINGEFGRHTLKNRQLSKMDCESDLSETSYLFDGGNEEFGLVGDAGQTEDVPEENKSLLWTLLKQVRPGMDLSKVVLPTFILEPRSFLEKLTDYYYHCDIISKAALEDDPLLRMKLILKWYLSGFYKKPKGLKKPYNPILGETFRCFWHHPETDSKSFYIAEQVSHHPPISAFYVTNRKDGFCISGSILAKSKFYGNSISAILDGTARLTLLARGEDYLITFPYAHCKGIFLGPLAFELGGKVTITCEKTGYKSELEFKLKPFFGSEDQCNLVVGKLRLGNETLGTIDGHWDSEIYYKDKRKGESELFWSGIDPNVKSSRLRRFVVPLDKQVETESEKLWHKVTLAIQKQDQNAATVEKTILEEAQRESAKQRASRMEMWTPKLFVIDANNNDWHYKMAEVRPWDNRTDVKQYEFNYVIRTFTRHLTPKPTFIKSPKPSASDQDIFDSTTRRMLPSDGAHTKLRFRRQHTCPDGTSEPQRNGHFYAHDSGKRVTAMPGSQELHADSGSYGQLVSSGKGLGRQLEDVNTTLASIKQAIESLQRDQNSVRTELVHLRNSLQPSGSSTCHRAIVRTGSGSTFAITAMRFQYLLERIPSEIRLVAIVLLTHLILNFILS